MLRDLSVLYAPEIKEGGQLAALRSFTRGKDEISLAEAKVRLLVFHRDALLRPCFQGFTQAGEAVAFRDSVS